MGNKRSKWTCPQENSLNFIKEFLLEKELRKDIAGESCRLAEENQKNDVSADNTEILSEPRPFDGNIHEGDIRLLSQTEELQYVVVLEQRNCNFLVVPFSPYSFPATDAELALKNDGGAFLQVLQVWNTRTIHYLQLKQSYYVAELPDDVLEEIYAVRAHYLLQRPLPKKLEARTGVPIFMPKDPRIQYQEKSLAVFAAIDQRDFEILDWEERITDARNSTFFNKIQIPYAAAGKESFLSEVYDGSRYSAAEILKMLCGKSFKGVYYGPAEYNRNAQCWTMKSCQCVAQTAILWDKKEHTLTGFGELVCEPDAPAMIFLRCRTEFHASEDFLPQNIVVIICQNE